MHWTKPGDNHVSPFGICMWLVLEINAVLNQKGCKNMEKPLHAKTPV